MKNTPGPACSPLPPSLDCILTLLPQQPSAEDAHVHAQTHSRAQTHIRKHPTRSYTKQAFILSDASLLLMFLHLCVRVCVLVFPLLSGLKTTELSRPLPLPPSLSLPLSPCLFFPLSAVVRERQAQPFLQIPARQTARRRSACPRNGARPAFGTFKSELLDVA